ncbi:MAG: winged helix DNA-binding domain-containing protein [Flavipsychrobacter sp.]|nr:winged helix DNA-binding domain-containing protein [Flavipsychrobacter sp.]
MTPDDIAKCRLGSQQLLGTSFTTPRQMVGYLGAMQAQDYAMAKWAIGIRLAITEKKVEEALNIGDIVRTHILRPTWHFVSVDDIGWMLKLTAPHIKTVNNAMCRKFELDTKILNRCNTIIENALAGGKHLTRDEVMLLLDKKGIRTDDIRSALIMMNAELDGIVINGVRREKQFTYSLLDLSKAKTYTKEEGLAELAKRYFISHGPATMQDFTWWSGLSVANSKIALSAIAPTLDSVVVAEQTYWFDADKCKTESTSSIHLLPAFDEFTISYKDRSASIKPHTTRHVLTNNGIFKPMIVVNGQVMGIWKRTIKKDLVIIETLFFDKMSKAKEQAIFKATKAYGEYMKMECVVR